MALDGTAGVLVPQAARNRVKDIATHRTTSLTVPALLRPAPEPISKIAGNSANPKPVRLGMRSAL